MINDFTKKESPFLSLAGLGGGVSSQLFVTSAVVVGTATTVATRSLRLNSSDSAYLNRTPAAAGNRKTWTWSGWMKLSKFGGDPNNFFFGAGASDEFYICQRSSQEFHIRQVTGGSEVVSLITDNEFRDTGAWGNLVVAVDTGQATASNRIKVYWNGSQITSFSTATYPSQNLDTHVNNNVAHYIGKRPNGTIYLDSYLTDVYFVDGSQLSPTAFGYSDLNGIWQNHLSSESLGTNGFHLDFNDNSSSAAIGKDKSGRNNDFTVNNVSVSSGADNDILFDAPSNGSQSDTGAGGQVSGNYCCLNPLHRNPSGNATATNGNLVWGGSDNNHHTIAGTFSVSSGKYYWEATMTANATNYIGLGMCKADHTFTNIIPGYDEDTAFTIYNTAGRYYYNSTSTSAYGTSWTTGDVIGVRYDEGKVYFYKNGTIMNASPILTLTGSWCPMFHTYDTGQWTVNFGQRPFVHSAPTNHKPLCSSLLPTPAVANGADHFATSLWTVPSGSADTTISGLNFAPDILITKNRSQSYEGSVYDTVRGDDKHLRLFGSEDSAESTAATRVNLTSDGFVLEADNDNSNYTAGSNSVGWTWNAGTSTVTNTDGTISAQVRANQTAGISVATYTGNQTSGATIGHGLGVAPSWWVMKSRSNSGMWVLRHAEVANTNYLQWGTDHAPRNAISDVTGDADSTSTVVPIGAADANNNNVTHVAYMFAPVEGFSAMGKYTGNGSTDGNGPFINCGFRPAWIMFKNVSVVSNYRIFDSTRDPINYVDRRLFVDSTSAESQNSTQRIDILSNGFRVLGNSSASTFNISGQEIIYVAFAEHPFQANGGLAR